MKVELLHKVFLESTGICTDTRNIKSGSMFFSLKGDAFNGNKFAAEAIDKGAFKVIIDEEEFQLSNGKTILVRNCLTALQQLANYHRKYLKLPIIALTGSNGKTTTKELINAVLSTKYKTVSTKGNLNNHIGVPLTLLSMDTTTEIGIVEMGANHHKEIEQLCEITLPDYGYITNFGKAHLEGFGSVEGVISAKSEMYENLRKYNKKAFINAEDALQVKQSANLDIITFGSTDSNLKINLIDASERLLVSYQDLGIQSNLMGDYNFNNIAAAIAIGSYFKVSKEQIKTAIENYSPTNNRSQLIEKGNNKILMDAYNANPTSMLAAIQNFKQANGFNKILILGDMFELGKDAESEHQNITDLLEQTLLGKIYLVGENFYKAKVEASHIRQFKSYSDFSDFLKVHIPENSYILIKGSRGMALERVLEII